MKTTVETITHHSVEIPKQGLIDMLNEAVAVGKGGDFGLIPPDAAVYMDVPGGGDYSGTELHMDRQVTLNLRWSVKS